MAVYRRYGQRNKIPWKFVLWVLFILVVFALTALLGHYLGEKAKGAKEQYTGKGEDALNSQNLTPISEKSLQGVYCEPEAVAAFTSDSENIWASTWIYKDGKAAFATVTDEKLLRDVSSLPAMSSFDTAAGTIGLFEVSSVYSDEQVKAILTEYELSLLAEYSASELDEIVLVFGNASEDNIDEILAFAHKVQGAKVLCLPYDILQNDILFAKAAENQIPLAIMAKDVTSEQLYEDINRFAFCFTRYNLRLVIPGESKELAKVLEENTLPNYQFCSPFVEEKK